MMDDAEPSGLADAIEAFTDACGKKDWKEAEQSFRDMCRLRDDDSKSEPDEDDKEEKGGKKTLTALVFGKK